MSAFSFSIQDYSGALRGYLRMQNEETLFIAYEIGRTSLADGDNVLDVVTVHQRSMILILRESESAERARELAGQSVQFCLETLSPFEMAQHGLMESVATLNEIAMDLVSTSMALRAEAAQREKAEKGLEHKASELARSNAELEQFAYVASHDLQEPIRSLVSFSTLLRKDLGGELSGAVAEDLSYITAAAKRMQRLIQDLLALSRVGRGAMKRELVALNDCVSQALEALRLRVEETQAQVHRAPLPKVTGDRTLLTQLYQNLIGNALKFTTAGEPVIEMSAQEDNGFWTLGVRDNGIGLKPEYAQQIFSPFKRLHGMTEFEGTGIGLAICQSCVERHGGKIWVESEPGKGAHFKFTLPVKG